MRDREAETQAEGEAGREHDVGLYPGTLGSHPEPKANAQLLSRPGIPECVYFLSEIGSKFRVRDGKVLLDI